MATRLTRRGLLQGAAAGVAAACAPRESGKDSGDPAVQPGKIEHIVMVMMENRSFDHWYGARALHEGRSDEDGLTAGMSNPSPQGEDIPVFHATELCPNDPPHGWSSSHDQFNAGACDGFARVHGTSHGTDGAEAMAYLQREDLPISYALADGYRLCDRYFCSLMTGTWPNRLYGQMGSSQGLTGNSLPSDGSGLTDASVWKKLDEAGVDWGFYYSDLSFLSLLHNQVDVSRGKGIEELFSALERGELPPVVWVDPAFSYNDNHPPHHPALGELFLAALHEALATSPLWDKVLVLITYDEHGGFFDHVPPPLAADDRAADGFDQLGFRVPSLLLGGYVKPGVDHAVYDHTSWLAWICQQHGIAPWTARIAAADPLSAVLDADAMAAGQPRPPIELPGFSFDESQLGPECSYFDLRDHQHLERLRQRMLELGLPDGLQDRRKLATLFQQIGRRRGLVG